MAEAGRLTPCQRYPAPFTRDGRLAPGLRAVAVDLCGSCPVLDAYAEEAGESWHVWGGRDRGAEPVRGDE